MKFCGPAGKKKSVPHHLDAARTFYGRKSRYLPGRSSDSRLILGPRLPKGFPNSRVIPSGIMQPSSPLTALAQRYGFAPYSLFTAAIPEEGRRHQRRSVGDDSTQKNCFCKGGSDTREDVSSMLLFPPLEAMYPIGDEIVFSQFNNLCASVFASLIQKA